MATVCDRKKVGDSECPYQLNELQQQTAQPSAAPSYYKTFTTQTTVGELRLSKLLR